jgi:carbon monoxide dehydrogenase subunit G
MEIKNEFDIPLPLAEAWAVLMDIPRIAPCVPGATLVGQTADSGYQGKVSVKLGPIALAFKGVANFIECDAAAKRVRLNAKGADQQGRGGASGVVTFQLTPAGMGTHVDVVTDVTLTGLIAQYGRGTGVIQGVATEICNQFASNLRALIVAQSGASQDQSAGDTIAEVPASQPIGGFSLILKVLWQRLRSLWSRT